MTDPKEVPEAAEPVTPAPEGGTPASGPAAPEASAPETPEAPSAPSPDAAKASAGAAAGAAADAKKAPEAEGADGNRRPARPPRSPVAGFLRVTAALAMTAAIVAACGWGVLTGIRNAAKSAEPPPLLEGVPFSTALYSREGELLRLTPASDGIFRLRTPLSEIDAGLVEATICYEDRNFRRHPGIDFGALLRAAAGEWLGGPRSGASTLTMQLARLRLNLRTNTPKGKIAQIWHALRYEAHYTKDQILEAYLNLAPYGGNVEGAGAAAAVWFRAPVSRLEPAQAAALAVIPQNPVKRRPRAEGNDALDAARLRLARTLVERGVFPPEREAALRAPLETYGPDRLPFRAPHYAQIVLGRAAGLKHPTGRLRGTLSLEAQTALERLVADTVARLAPWGVRNAAVSVVDGRDRSLVALVGSADFFDAAISGEVNAWTAPRSPGSMLKPFTYGLALDRGLIHGKTILIDAPRAFGGWAPENADGEFRGPLTAEAALVSSRNLPAVELERRLNPGLYELLARSGVKLPHEKSWYGLSIVLGGAEVTMADAQKLYAMLAGDGLLRPIRLLESDAAPAEGEVLSREAQFALRRMLASRGETLPAGGARRELLYKTGTSNGWRDAWTAGTFGPYSIVVWLGDFSGAPNPQLQGARLAAPLFKAAALRLASLPGLDWPRAETPEAEARRLRLKVALEPVCTATGDLDVRLCADRTESWILPGRTSVRDSGVLREIWIDRKTGLRGCRPGPDVERRVWEFWPTDYQRVFLAAGIVKRPPPPYTPECAAILGHPGGRAPVITAPKPGAVLYASGSASARTLLRAGADSDTRVLYWYADGGFLGAVAAGRPLEWLAPAGTHELTVTDDLGRTGSTKLIVRRR